MYTQQDQIIHKIQESNNILLLSKQAYSGDDLAAILAWKKFLEGLNKQCDAVISGFSMKSALKFLPGWDIVKNDLAKLKKFTIAVDISKTKLADFSYDANDNELLLYITPERGFLENNDIRFRSTNYKYDLIICLGVQDFESIGSVYQQHADFFYHTPIINIDNHNLNEHFGDINEIDITQTSTCAISYDLLRKIDSNSINRDIATCLLTGIISATKSFRTPNVNPQTLQLASELIQYGADRKEIVEKLFNTRSVATLKLWGRVLARLKSDNKNKIVWSTVNQNDILRSGANIDDLTGVIDELIITSPQAEIAIIFYTQEYGQTDVYLYSSRNFDSIQLANRYQPKGDKTLVKFSLNLAIEQAETEVLYHIIEKINSLLP